MLIKMLPAKRLTVNGKVSTYKLEDSPVSYFCPSLEDISTHLQSTDALKQLESKPTSESSFDSGLPVYVAALSNWLMSAVNSAAQVKARAGFTVSGTTPETLSVELGDLPTSMEDLLSSERAGGPYMRQKAEFVSAFKIWALDGGVKRPQQYINALAGASLANVREEAIPHIKKALAAFITHLELDEEELTTQYGVYLNAANRQLEKEQEEEDWSFDD